MRRIWARPGRYMRILTLIVLLSIAWAHQAIPMDSGSGALPRIVLSAVRYWGYQLQGISDEGAVDKLKSSKYDLLVLEPTRTDGGEAYFDTARMVATLKNSAAHDGKHRKLVLAYIDIGEAEDWRWYWTWSTRWAKGRPRPADWPTYILAHDPDGWDGNYPVAYWDPKWKDIMIHGVAKAGQNYNSALDEVIKDGFDGVYLDWVEGYEDTDVMAAARAAGKDPAVEMIRFMEEIREYATQQGKSDFIIIQQNAAALVDGHSELLDVIDGIAQEGIWFDGEATDDWRDSDGYDSPQDEDLVDYYLENLAPYKQRGLPVFDCEYALRRANDAYAKAAAHGFIPYVTRRSLGKLTTTPPPGY